VEGINGSHPLSRSTIKKGTLVLDTKHTFFLIPEVLRSRHVALAIRRSTIFVEHSFLPHYVQTLELSISHHMALALRCSTISIEHSFLPHYVQIPELSISLHVALSLQRSTFYVGRSYIVPRPTSFELPKLSKLSESQTHHQPCCLGGHKPETDTRRGSRGDTCP